MARGWAIPQGRYGVMNYKYKKTKFKKSWYLTGKKPQHWAYGHAIALECQNYDEFRKMKKFILVR